MKKIRTIQVRLNDQEYQELLQKCSQSKMQLSMFVRSCLAEAKVTEMGHKQEMVPLIMEMYSILNQMPETSALGVIALRPLAGLVCLGLSFLLSCRIVDRKEF